MNARFHGLSEGLAASERPNHSINRTPKKLRFLRAGYVKRYASGTHHGTRR